MVRTRPGTFGRTTSQMEEIVTPHLLDDDITDENPASSDSDVDIGDVEQEIARKAEEMRKAHQAKVEMQKRKRLAKQRRLEAEQAQQRLEAELAQQQQEAEERLRQEEEEERLRLEDAERDRELQVIADENERQRSDELRERAKQDRQRQRLRKGKAIATPSDRQLRRRRSNADQDYEPELEEDNVSNEEPTPLARKSASRKRQTQPDQSQEGPEYIISMLLNVGFTSTCYPDMGTADKLGIRSEVERLLAGCGLSRYMSMAQNSYAQATAEFLATLHVSELRDSVALIHQMGGGYITFIINNVEYTLSLKDIQEHFGFPPGKPNLHDIEKSELSSIWELLTGDRAFDNWAKGSRIRNPAVAYVRKAIAETFCARNKTGPCSAGDMHMLIAGLKNVFGSNPATEQEIIGDKANTGIAYVLVKQLEAYRGKLMGQIKRGAELAPLSIGGPIAEIMKLAGVEMNWDAEHHEPTFMDIDYLRGQRLLVGPRGDKQLYYKFQHPDQPEGRIILPNIALTSFADPLNVMFIPPAELLIDPSTLTYKKSPSRVEKALTAGSTRRKRATPTLKERMLGTVPCLGTKEEIKAELRDELLKELEAKQREMRAKMKQEQEEMRAKIRQEQEEMRAEVQHEQREENEKFLKRMKKKMKEYYEQMEKIFVKKPPQLSRHLSSSPVSGANPTKRPNQIPTSESPSGSGSMAQKRKVPRRHSPPKGDQDTPAQDQTTPDATPPLSL